MPVVSEGYVYVADDDDGVMARAIAGARISLKDRRSPWIVVYHSVNSICVAQWPGKLWRVSIIDAKYIEQANSSARYTRAFEVAVLEGLPLSRLFGERGEAVCSVISRSSRLELSEMHLLAGTRHPEAAEAYSRVWNDWLTSVGGTEAYRGENLQGTLGILAGGSQSPINDGLMVLYETISIRAEKLTGSAAFIVNEDGDKYLEPAWAAASVALLEAAMAFGAQVVSESDRQIMSAAWHSVFPEDP
ncbi:MAG: hypothetical protein NTW19_02605 [Planctomycetota bacterium]|nr:hypothetical protein [Planctomycetota bacterium]